VFRPDQTKKALIVVRTYPAPAKKGVEVFLYRSPNGQSLYPLILAKALVGRQETERNRNSNVSKRLHGPKISKTGSRLLRVLANRFFNGRAN
jgi:hypothetical protein